MNNELPNIPELEISLNIYDLHKLNYYLHPIGIGAYHTGVQLFDVEFAFGSHENSNTGVYESEPKKSYQAEFRQTIFMGVTKLSIEDILNAIEELKIEYAGCTYNLFHKNCNHFSDDLCKRLLGIGIPKYLNRLASLCGLVKCLLPRDFLEVNDPVISHTKHKKKDSLYLAAKRINRKKTSGMLTPTNSSQIETISLAKNDEKQQMIPNNQQYQSQKDHYYKKQLKKMIQIRKNQYFYIAILILFIIIDAFFVFFFPIKQIFF